jgi:hypothetical protein
MTYNELYSQATTWTAAHVANDLRLMMGGDTEVSRHDLEKVARWQTKEGGNPIQIGDCNNPRPLGL